MIYPRIQGSGRGRSKSLISWLLPGILAASLVGSLPAPWTHDVVFTLLTSEVVAAVDGVLSVSTCFS